MRAGTYSRLARVARLTRFARAEMECVARGPEESPIRSKAIMARGLLDCALASITEALAMATDALNVETQPTAAPGAPFDEECPHDAGDD
jgi:hypothetical protein